MNYSAPKVRQVSLRTCSAVEYILRVICLQNFRKRVGNMTKSDFILSLQLWRGNDVSYDIRMVGGVPIGHRERYIFR